MKPVWGDDYSICCCVSATQTGKEMQFFGARANLAKCLLYAINGGVDEKSRRAVRPQLYAPITASTWTTTRSLAKYDVMMDWLAGLYVNILNLIQYMHDKYYYEAAEMALIDTDVRRTFATGIAGFSHVVDSLSAIKYAKVKCIRNEQGLVTDYEIEGDFPKYGNDDDRADDIAVELLRSFLEKIKRRHTYRNSEAYHLDPDHHLQRRLRQGHRRYARWPQGVHPVCPRRQPELRRRDPRPAGVPELRCQAALPLGTGRHLQHPDHQPRCPGPQRGRARHNLVQVMDGYFDQGAHHLNVNVFGVEKLLDAMEHPEKEEYANFTIRVSGYAVKFIDLTKEQQLDVIARTCHKVL